METETIVKDIDHSGDQGMLDDNGVQDESSSGCDSKEASTAAGDKQSGSSSGSSSSSSGKHSREDDGKRKARGRDSDGKDLGGRGREQDRRGGRSGDRDRSRDRSRRDSSRDRDRHREGRGGHSGEVCRNFLNNRCFRGTLCKFRHPSPERGGGGSSGGGDGDGDNSSSVKGEKEVSKTQQHEDVVCRDFLRNMCQRGSECRFYHPESKEQEKRSWLTFCHDFQNGRCYRTDCRFFHVTPEDEGYYHRTGNISVHIVDQAMRKALMLDVSLMGTRPVCKDYLKGLCTHQTCRFRHLTRREYEHEVYLALENEFEKTLGSPKHLEGSDAKRMRLDSRERDLPSTDIGRTSPVTNYREDYPHRIDESRPYRYTGERTERDDTNQYNDRFVDSSFRPETRSLSHSPDLTLREGGMKNIMRENCNMLKVEIDELRKENSFLRRENIDLRRTVDQQSSQIQDKMRRIMRENDDLKNQLQKKGGTEKAELVHKLKKTENENMDLKMSLSRAQDKIDQLVSEADKAKSNLNELKSKLESLETMSAGQNQGSTEYWNSQESQMYSNPQNSYTYPQSLDRSYTPQSSNSGSSALGCQGILGASTYVNATGLLPTPIRYGTENQGSLTPRRGQSY
ncbi:uncharacterized protein LOC143020292 isoform X2 [Oratosquilla oratoria]|uniref:uncharacterized protein LOC143020292 isoform X2 n=1 Tax=Oratosquilla oratoria TaxID=337810 RepID=UPI003F75C444